jgi:cytochrome c biogenesis protein CcmG/thiol:disulfide interchange protein DsbE
MKLFTLATIILLCSFNVLQDGEKKLPSVIVKSVQGKHVDISTITNNNKPILILVMEVTCKPCIAEFDNISDLYEDWQKETGVKIIAVSVDDSRSTAKVVPLAISKGWQFEFYTDVNQDFKRALSIPFCPYCIIIDGKGNIVWQKSAYLPGDENIIFDILKKVSKD